MTSVPLSGPNAPVGPLTFKEFLESVPPGQQRYIRDLATLHANGRSRTLAEPVLTLHCMTCEGPRVFQVAAGDDWFSEQGFLSKFVSYMCRNCRRGLKTFAIQAFLETDQLFGKALKWGEQPDFGAPLPSRLISILGPDYELFLKGRRSENRALGIGAFIYYRRVVENQKNRLLLEIRKVAERNKASPELLARLDAALAETRFSESINLAKDALPPVLLIDGQHNPLTILHSKLSEHVHERSDDECLQLAADVRILLSDLAERLTQALKDDETLRSAISRLFKPSRSSGDGAQE